MGISLKKIGRMIDPTSSKSALGGVTRAAIQSVPGGSTVLSGLSAAKQATQADATNVKKAADQTAKDKQAAGQIVSDNSQIMIAGAVAIGIIAWILLK